jgi:hypothetical protein
MAALAGVLKPPAIKENKTAIRTMKRIKFKVLYQITD